MQAGLGVEQFTLSGFRTRCFVCYFGVHRLYQLQQHCRSRGHKLEAVFRLGRVGADVNEVAFDH